MMLFLPLGIMQLTLLGLGVSLPLVLEPTKALQSNGQLVYEYYDDKVLSPSLCDEFCSYTYPAHTYPVADHGSACRQGCLLTQLYVPLEDCRKECLTLFTSEVERYACHVGCNKLPPPQQDGDVKASIAIALVRKANIGSSLFNIIESIKSLFFGEDKDENSYFNKLNRHIKQDDLADLRYTESDLKSGVSVPDHVFQDIEAATFKSAYQFDHSSVVYISKSIHYVTNTPFLDKLQFSIGVILILLGCSLLILSLIRDLITAQRDAKAERLAKEETVKLSFKALFENGETPCDNIIGSELFLAKKRLNSPPISIVL